MSGLAQFVLYGYCMNISEYCVGQYLYNNVDKTTLISLLYWVSNCPGNMPTYYPGNMPTYYPGNMPTYYPGNMPKYYSTKYHYRNLHEV